MWMAEWVRPRVAERTIGILKLRDGKLTFSEQTGQGEFSIDLSSVKRIVNTNGRALKIETISGETYVVAIMDASLTIGSPKKVIVTIDRALRDFPSTTLAAR